MKLYVAAIGYILVGVAFVLSGLLANYSARGVVALLGVVIVVSGAVLLVSIVRRGR